MERLNNDEKIIVLKKKIEEKRASIDKAKKFSPKTNCSLLLNNERYNINTLDKDGVIALLVRVNALRLSADDLCIECMLSGYLVTEWIDDLKTKLDIINIKEEESKLKAMESKLDTLLSNDKKVEMEIGEIEEMLNEK